MRNGSDVNCLLRWWRPCAEQVTTVSKGKQLIDLKKAADEGAISQGDYTKEKSKILGEDN